MIINKEDCFYLGYTSKSQGFKGGMIVFLDVDIPENYSRLDRVLVDLHGMLTPFFIEEIRIKDKGFAFMKFQGVNDENSAKNITGKEMYLPLGDLPVLPEDQYYLHELIGMKVVDSELGDIGKVDKVLDYPTNNLLQIFRNSQEILIPLIDAFVEKVDKGSQTILVHLPEGLIELNEE